MAIDTTNSFLDEPEARKILALSEEDHRFVGRLHDAINGAAMIMNHFTRRNLKSRAYTNKFYDGDGSDTFFLEEFPVDLTAAFTVRVSSTRVFTEDDLTRWDQLSSANGTDYMVDDELGEVVRIDGDVWPCVRKSIRVSFTAGVAAASEEGLVAKEAQGILVQDLYARMGDNPSIGSESVAGESVSYIRDWMPIAARVLLLGLQKPSMFA